MGPDKIDRQTHTWTDGSRWWMEREKGRRTERMIEGKLKREVPQGRQTLLDRKMEQVIHGEGGREGGR